MGWARSATSCILRYSNSTIVPITSSSSALKVSQCRVRALPLHSGVEAFVERHQIVIVLEINRDGQMYSILRSELPAGLVSRLRSVAYSDGISPRAQLYADAIRAELQSFEVA